jgi:hypothetical protein
MSNSDIESYLNFLEQETKGIKDEIFRLSWYMRGGVSSEDLFHRYSYEDRIILNEIIKDNIELTKKSGLSLL